MRTAKAQQRDSGSLSGDNTIPQRAQPPLWFVAAVLAASLFVVYSRAFNAPLIFDDESSITENTSIHSLWPLFGTTDQPGPLRSIPELPTAGRPLVNLSFAINYHFGGTDPLGYHIVNLILHFLSALLLWEIVRRTLLLPRFKNQFDAAAGWLALAVALLWALHPLQTEAVIYITQRTELMVAIFLFATLYCSLRYWSFLPLPLGEGRGEGAFTSDGLSNRQPPAPSLHPPRSWLLLATLACACGMASKEIMVAAPLIVLLFDRAFVSGSISAALRRSKPLYAALATTWLVLLAVNLSAPRSQSAGFHLGLSLPSWWATQCQVLLVYLKLAVWPAPLLLHYELPYLTNFGDASMYVLPVVALAVIALALLWRNSPAGFLLVAAAMVLAPTSIVPLPTEMAAERRMYLPLASLASLFVVGAYLFIKKCFEPAPNSRQPAEAINLGSLFGIVCGLLIAVVFAVTSAARLQTYNDPLQLWQEVVAHQPNNYLAHYNLGLILNHAGREQESFAELQASVAANPNSANARSAFGFALMNAGRIPEAIDSLKAALALEPNHVGALNNMGRALNMTEQNAEAISYLKLALEANPSHAEAHHNLGKALANTGQLDAAIDQFKAALQLAPGDIEVLNSLATAYRFGNRFPDEIQVLQQAVALHPDNGGLHNTLGIALYHSGDTQRALEQFRRLLALNPTNVGAHMNLGNIYAEQGDFKSAVPYYEQAVKLQPNFPEGQFSLALALVNTNRVPESIDHFQAAIKQNPGFLPVYLQLAKALAAAHRKDEAIAAAKQGIEIARTAGDKASADQLEEWLKKYPPDTNN